MCVRRVFVCACMCTGVMCVIATWAGVVMGERARGQDV